MQTFELTALDHDLVAKDKDPDLVRPITPYSPRLTAAPDAGPGIRTTRPWRSACRPSSNRQRTEPQVNP